MANASPHPERYRIDDLVLEPGTRRVLRDGQPIDLPKLSFDLLLALVRAAPNVVEVDELMETVWGDVVVNDETLTQRVKMLRDALDADGDKQSYVETVRGVGYRLRPTAVELGDPSPMSSANRLAGVAILVVAALAVAFYVHRSVPVATPAAGSVAVLPFVALTAGADDGYFADGLTEEILNSLAHLPELSVTARTSSFYFKGKDLPVPDIAKTLGVAHVVEGSIRRYGEQLRVTAQLIRAEDGFHVWSESFDRTLDDVFAVQIDIAEKVATALDVVLDDDSRQQMNIYGLRDPEAFIAFQKGREFFAEAHATAMIRPGLLTANEYFDQVLALAPEFADAYLLHSDYYSHVLITLASGFRPADITDEIEAIAASALVADLDAAIRHARNERQRRNAELDRAVFTGNWQGIRARLDRTMAEVGCLTPNWVDVVALPYGNANASRAAFINKVECDPLEFGGHLHLVRMHTWLGDFDASLEASIAGLDATDNPLFHLTPILGYLGMGRLAQAELVIEREVTDELMKLRGRIYVAAMRSEAEAVSDLIQRFNQEQGWTYPAELIQFHAVNGDRANANRVAAVTDANPFGHMVLAHAVLTCYCGAPFDLDATPNFAGIIAESGLTWPPTTPLRWPLKTW